MEHKHQTFFDVRPAQLQKHNKNITKLNESNNPKKNEAKNEAKNILFEKNIFSEEKISSEETNCFEEKHKHTLNAN